MIANILTNVTLSHEQLQAIVAEVAGSSPEDVAITPIDGCPNALVSATIKTDFKGAGRLQRVLAKFAGDKS